MKILVTISHYQKGIERRDVSVASPRPLSKRVGEGNSFRKLNVYPLKLAASQCFSLSNFMGGWMSEARPGEGKEQPGSGSSGFRLSFWVG